MTEVSDIAGRQDGPDGRSWRSAFSRWVTLPGREPSTRNEWAFSLSAISIAAIAAIWVFYTSAHGILDYHIPMIFWDEWEMVATWNQWVLKGSLESIIDLHNEHRLGPTRLAFLADFAFADGTGYLNLTFIWLVQLGHLILLWWMFRLGSNAAGWAQVLVFLMMVPFFFSARQAENLEIGFQVQFVGVYFLGSLAFWALNWSTLNPDGSAKSKTYWPGLIAALVLATTATLTMVSGLLVWPVMLLLAIRRRVPWITLAILVGATGLAWSLYFQGYDPPGHHPSPLENLRDPENVLRFLALLLGSPMTDSGQWRTEVGLLSLLGAMALMAYALLARKWRPNRAEATLICAAAFAFGAMLVTTLGRADLGLPQAVVNRYATPVYVFFVSMVLVFLCRTRFAGSIRMQGLSVAVGAVVLALIISAVSIHPGHLLGQFWLLDRKGPGWTSIVSGVADEDALLSTYPFLERTERRLRILKRDGKAPFRGEAFVRIGTPVADLTEIRDDQACRGAIDKIEVVPPLEGWPGRGVRLEGWAYDKDRPSRAPRLVFVTDQDDMIRGVGLTGWFRHDVENAFDEIHILRTGWKGHARVRPGERLNGWVVTSDDRLCRFPDPIVVPGS